MPELIIPLVFLVMVSIATLLFEELGDRIEGLARSSSHLSLSLNQWKRHYHLVCLYVESINKMFGLILLITVGHIAINMTIHGYPLMYAFKNANFSSNELIYLVRYSHYAQILLLITLSTWQMKNQVCYLGVSYSILLYIFFNCYAVV